MNVISFKVPEDLWYEYENLCKNQKTKPLQSLKLRLLDAVEDTKALTMGLLVAMSTTRSPTSVIKGVRWTEDVWDPIRGLSQATGLTNQAIIRLVIENAVRDQSLHCAFYKEGLKP